MMMGSKLVLTGVTNNPGRVCVEYIGSNAERIHGMFPGGVRAVCRASSDTADYRRLLPDDEVRICDLTDPDGLREAFEDADTVLHMAGIYWSRQVADAAAFCGVRRLIAVHTCGIYSKYKEAGEEYRRIDEYCYKVSRDNGIALTILRPTMIYGNSRDRNVIKFITMADRLPLMPMVNGGRYELQPVHYRDLGKAFYDVLVNEESTAGRDFILSGRSPILLRDMFTEIGRNLGKEMRFISCPYPIAYTGAAVINGLTLGRIDYREKVKRLCEPRAYGHAEASEAFGYDPRPFEEGIAEEVREYRDRKWQILQP